MNFDRKFICGFHCSFFCGLFGGLIVWSGNLPSARAELSVAPEEERVHYLSAEEAVRIALEGNVDLLAFRNQQEAFHYQSLQALSPNEPTLSFNRTDIPKFSLQTPAETTYAINWTLGFPGKALSVSAAIRHQGEAVAEQAKAQEINIMTTLAVNYAAFTTNQAFYKFLLDEQQKDKDLIKLIEKRFAASQASKVDLLNAQVATEQIAQAILENRNDYDILLTQFRRIIHRPTDKTLMPLIPETVSIPTVVQSFDELVPMMLKNNQAVAAAQQTVESQQALLNNAKLQALPDFQFSAGRNDWVPTNVPSSPNFKGHDYTIGVGMVIPLFFALDGLQGIHAAAKNRDAAENQLSSAQLQAISGLQTSYTSYKAALKDLVTSETLVVPAAKQSFELTLLTYALGKADYLIVNQSRQAWHEASRELINKRQNAVQLYNQLIAQVGCDLNQSEGPHACKN